MSENYTAVVMKPKGSFHFGGRGVGLESTTDILHSDTLFSAICWGYLHLYGRVELEALLTNFENRDPPFLISSAFVYYEKDSKRTYFLPKPMLPIRFAPSETMTSELLKQIKKLKDVKYVTKSLFELYLSADQEKIDEIPKKLDIDYIITQGKFLGKSDEIDKDVVFHRTADIPRNLLDRATNFSNIYYFGELVFTEKSGLYFLIKDRKQIIEKIKSVMRFLEDEGIGGDRTIGKGSFECFYDDFSLSLPTDTKSFVTLSLYYPSLEEVTDFEKRIALTNYELITRRGYVFSPYITRGLRKKAIRVFSEGSAFPLIKGNGVYGALPKVLEKDVTGSHDVFRYGFAFPIMGETN